MLSYLLIFIILSSIAAFLIRILIFKRRTGNLINSIVLGLFFSMFISYVILGPFPVKNRSAPQEPDLGYALLLILVYLYFTCAFLLVLIRNNLSIKKTGLLPKKAIVLNLVFSFLIPLVILIIVYSGIYLNFTLLP